MKEGAIKGGALKLWGIGSLSLCFLLLFILLLQVGRDGFAFLSWNFLTSFPSRFPEKAGVASALLGTFWIMGLTALFSIPLGILTALYLEEYASNNRATRLIRLNIQTLAGVPSIIYGILGLAVFVRAMDLNRSILAGSLTMTLMILPMVIIATSEALKAVPPSLRWAAYAVGATRLQVVWSHLLPQALPGIMTGIILALSRAVGEAAPLIMIGALSFVAFVPTSPMDSFTVLAIQIFNWAGRPEDEFRMIAASAIIVLLVFTLGLNSLAIYLRARAANRQRRFG
jgi:phosphate transport system permease protein